MNLKDVPYYVKFIFTDHNDCYSIADKETLCFVKNSESNKSISSLKIGQSIYMEPNSQKTYVITDIRIKDIVDDLEVLKYGIDPEDCNHIQGDPKVWLFTIVIELNSN